MKRLLCILLALAMCLSLLSLGVLAEGEASGEEEFPAADAVPDAEPLDQPGNATDEPGSPTDLVIAVPDPQEIDYNEMVASVTVSDITRLTTDINGWQGYWDQEQDLVIELDYPWRINCWPYGAAVTVIMWDGTAFSGDPDEVYMELLEAYDFDFFMAWNTDETPDNLWGVGDHTATFYVGNKTAEYTVHVMENPIALVEVAPFTRLDTDRFEDSVYIDDLDEWIEPGVEWRLNCWPAEIRVTSKDGWTFTGSPEEAAEFCREQYGLDVEMGWDSDETIDDPWGLGVHTAAFFFSGAIALYDVTVIENPIASVSVPDFTRPVNALSDWTDYYDEDLDDWADPGFPWRVDCWPGDDGITVTMKDGNVYSSNPSDVWDQIYADYGFEPEMYWGSEEPFTGEVWALGEHTAVFYVCGVTTEYTVTVIEDPIVSVEVADITRSQDDRFESMWYDDVTGVLSGPYRLLDLQPDSITVAAKDGKTYTGDPEEVYQQIHDDFGCYLDFWWTTRDGEIPDESWGPGEYTAVYTVNGISAEYRVTVTEGDTTPAITIDESASTAQVTGSFEDLYARVALVLDNGGQSGLYVTQVAIDANGTIFIPVFNVPGLTVMAVNVALVPTLADIQSPTPTVTASAVRRIPG